MNLPSILAFLEPLLLAASPLMLLLFWHKLWRPMAADLLRQDLFDLRTELFIRAQQQDGIGFSDAAYQRAREELNLRIRFAHGAAFFPCLLMRRLMPQTLHEKVEEARAFREALPAEQRRVLEQLDAQQFKALRRHLLLCSPLLWILAPSSALWRWLAKLLSGSRQADSAASASLQAGCIERAVEALEHQCEHFALLGKVKA